ncbi:MAG: hypothetical protein Q9226_003444, partial [Calogaya cf. arnoldii]
MISPIGMETFEARLESFNVAHQGSKKRTSNAKSATKLKWSHESPNPAQLARAGFFYNPKVSAPDNTTCYLCRENLDGWEEDDNPIEEHANLSPGCGWAAIARIEKNIEEDTGEQGDPMSEKLLDARRMTFGANWPHEDKRGDEHQRRSPDCIFFVLSTSKPKKTARAKKGRGSKASRVSAQSNLTTASEDLSMIDVNSVPETSIVHDVESSGAKKGAKGAKKGTKGRKAAPNSRGKASATQQEEMVVGSSFVEPEDDDFEVKVHPEPTNNERGKKRNSDEMSVGNESTPAELAVDHSQFPLPPPKRRATRASASYANKDPISTLEFTLDDDTLMEDVESIPQPTVKKTAKGGRKRTSSSVRKASTTSTATKASLRAAVPDDEEIDAALEADLDRPLTDDEDDMEPPPLPKTKSRRLTKTRPGSRKVTASTAPVRKTTRASTLPVEGDSMMSSDIPKTDSRDEAVQETEAVEIALKAVQHAKQEIIAETAKSTASKAKTRGRAPSKTTRTRKGSENKNATARGVETSQALVAEPEVTTQESTEPKSSQSADCLPARPSPTAEVLAGSNMEEHVAEVDSSLLAPPAIYGDCANESGTNAKAQPRVRGGEKKRTNTAAKKGKASKKGAPVDRDSENPIAVEVEHSRRNSPEPVVEHEIQPNNQVIEEPTLPNQLTVEAAQPSVEKASKPKKGRPAKVRAKPGKPSMETSVMEQKESAETSPMTTQKQVDMAEEIPVTTHAVPDNTDPIPPQTATPRKTAPSVHGTPKTGISPQSSDAENQPPSSRPSALRPPLSTQSPSKGQNTRVVLAATTPTASPSRRNISRLQSTLPWTAIDFEKLFMVSPAAEKENLPLAVNTDAKEGLASPEKKLTVEEWIRFNAQRVEDKLRDDCERLVGRFEGEGVRALKTLEGITSSVAVDEPGDFLPDGGVDEVVEEGAGVFEGESVGVGEVRDYQSVEFGG